VSVTDAGGTPREVAATTIVAVSLSTIFGGVGMLAMAHYKMGRLIQFVPTPVMAGFLAGNGWALVSGSLHLTSGLELKEWAHVKSEKIPAILFGLALGITLFLAKLSSRKKFPFILPLLLSVASAMVYIIIGVEGLSMSEAKANAWLLDVETTSEFWRGWELVYSFSSIHWGTVLRPFHFFFIFVINTVTVLLSAIGLESLFNSEADVDKELYANGVANTISGIGGGSPGLSKIGITIIHYDAGASSRLGGLVNNITVGAVLFLAGPSLEYLPLPVLGSMVFVIGIGLMYEYLVLRFHSMPTVDYTIMWIVVLFIAFSGCVVGCLVGLGLVAAQFIYEASHTNIVRQQFNGKTVRSGQPRTHEAATILSAKAHRISGLVLEGHVFFGTAQSIVTYAQRLRETAAEEDSTDDSFFILEFSRVTHLDSSAVGILDKLKTSAGMWKIHVLMVGASPYILKLLRQGGVLSMETVKPRVYTLRHFDSLDIGLQWCEDRLLASSAHTVSSAIDDSQQAIMNALSVDSHKLAVKDFMIMMAQCLGEEDPMVLIKVVDAMEILQPEHGSIVVEQGALTDDVWFILLGTVMRHRGSATEDMEARGIPMLPGAAFGIEAISTHAEFPNTITAGADCVLGRFSGDSIVAMEQSDPALAVKLQRLFCVLLSQKLRGADGLPSDLAPPLPPPGMLFNRVLDPLFDEVRSMAQGPKVQKTWQGLGSKKE